MATLSTLTVDIRTNSAKFNQGLDKAGRKLKRFTKGVNKASKAIGKLFKKVSVGALVGGGIFAVIIKQSLTAIDNIGKLSKTYGIATQDLAAFQLAAELGGSSLNTFAKAARNVSVAVFDFLVRGTGLAVDSFRQLGITQKDLIPIQNDNAALMGLIGDRLNEMEDGAVKTAVATKLLGGRAVELLPALAGGSAQMRKFKEETLLFGTALSTAAVKGVEDANDSITRLGFIFKGASYQITAALAPALELLVVKIQESILAAAKGQGGIEKFAQNIARGILGTFKTAIEGIQSLSSTVDTALTRLGLKEASSIDEIGRKLDGNLQQINSIFAKIKEAELDLADGTGFAAKLGLEYDEADLNKFKEQLKSLFEAREALSEKLASVAKRDSESVFGGIVDGLDDLIDSIGKAAPAFEPINTNIKDNIGLVNEAAEALKAYNKILAEGKALTLSLRTPQEIYEDSLFNVNDLLQEGVISYETYSRAIKKYQDDLDNASKKTDELGEFAKQAAKNIQNSLGDTLFNILDGKFDSIGASFDQLIKRMIANAAAAQIGQYLFPDLNKKGGGTGNSLFDNIISGLSGLIPEFANGTNFAPGGLALVGERGPELVNLPRGSQVISNDKMGGGSTVINNFTISAPIDNRSQQQIADAAYRGASRASARNR